MILFKKFGMKQVLCSEGSASPRHLRSQFNSGEKLKKKRKKNNEILHNGFIAPDWFNVLAIIYDVVKTVSQIIYNSRMTHYINTKSRLN